MSTRLLFFMSLVFAGVSAYLYFHQDSIDQAKRSSIGRYDYWANDIAAVQTNEQGSAALELTAEHLVHDPKTDILALKDLNAHMKQVGAERATFHFLAKQASWHQPTAGLKLFDGVTVTRTLPAETAKPSFADITFTTQAIQANTKSKTLVGHKPITMTMNNNVIRANAMRADLNRGEYEFDKLYAEYTK